MATELNLQSVKPTRAVSHSYKFMRDEKALSSAQPGLNLKRINQKFFEGKSSVRH
jgi:hypothetical protein